MESKSLIFKPNKIIIWALTALLLISITMVMIHFDKNALAESSFTNSKNNNSYSVNSTDLNIINSSKVTLNLVPNFIEIDKVTGQNKIDNKFNVTFSGHGIINNLSFKDNGFALVTQTSDGFSHIQGTVNIISNIGQEKGKYDLFAIGHTDTNGILKDNGVELFSTNSTGKMAFINNMVVVFTDEVNQNTGNGKTIGWELK